MMEIVLLLLSIAAATFVGLNILWLIFGHGKLWRAEELCVAYGLGIGAISLEMMIFYFLKARFSIPAILAPWLVIVAANAALFVRKRPSEAPAARANEKMGFFEVAVASAIVVEIAYAFFRALIRPIESYDAIAIYAIKSKIFYLAGSLPREVFSNLITLFPHPDYPLNIPLAQVYAWLFMGGLNDQLVKIIYPLFYLATIGMLYCAVKRYAGRKAAIICTFVLASVSQYSAFATNAYLEVPLAFYVFTGSLFLFRWIGRQDDLRSLAMSAVMIGLAGWTKNEGLLYCAIAMLIVVAAPLVSNKRFGRRGLASAAVFLCIILAVSAPWHAVKAEYRIANDEISLANVNPANLVMQLPKIAPITYELQKQLLGPKKWNILWIVAVFILFAYRKNLKGTVAGYSAAIIMLALCGYVTFYMISYVDVVFFASKTWSRFLLQFLPLLVLWMAYMVKEDIA